MIFEAENAIKAAISAALGESVAAVETHPGRWDTAAMQAMTANTPAVFVGFNMAGRNCDDGKEFVSRWHIYLVSDTRAGGAKLGVYELFDVLLPALQGLDLGHEDGLEFKHAISRFDFNESQQGFFCYEMVFEVRMHWPDYVDESELDAFARYHADYKNSTSDTLASADVELPQD